MGRSCRITIAVCVLLVLLPAVVLAARIDPELEKLLDTKRQETIPVLMVFPEPPDLDGLTAQLDDATPSKRRKSVIAALKRKVRKAQTEAWEILSDPDQHGVLVSSDMLYLANAIAFEGDREIILALAETKSAPLADAILFHDEPLELLLGAGAPGAAGVKAAAQDTVWSLRHLGVDRVWNELGFTGEGVIIGHVDTGVDGAHPDLRRRLRVNPGEIPDNGLDDDGNGLVDDVRGWDFGDDDADPRDDASIAGHGTHTAGILVGDGSAGLQTGVAPGARLVPAKVFASDGASSLGRIWAAQQYCLEQGARIISMSLGVKGEIPAAFLRNDRFNAEALRAAGVLLFNSGGNYHEEFAPPLEIGMTARIPSPWNPLPVPAASTGGVVAVGGTAHRSDQAWGPSSRGPVSWGHVEPWLDWPHDPGPGLIKPDVVAPAEGIQSTLPQGGYSGETWSGTSMACPHVAGIAALMLQKNPTLSPAGLDSLLQQTARDLGAPGKDPVFGSGAVDAHAAVAAVPLDLMPNLSEISLGLDPAGNQVLDPGEQVDVVVEVRNVGQVAATGVIGRLELAPGPYVVADRATSRLGDIAAGAAGDNAAQPFRLFVSPAAPEGAPFAMTLTLFSAEGFERSFDLQAQVGLPEWRTLDAGAVYLSITSRGSLGYLTDQQSEGHGAGLIGGPSALFTGSLWAGASAAYMCNNDLTAGGADPAEWIPRTDPSGNVAVVADGADGQTFALAFTDGGHPDPRDLEIELTARAPSAPDLAHVVILDYAIHNRGSRFIGNFHAGLFLDWDVVDLLGNVGGSDLDRRTAWVGMPDGPVFGQALVGDAPLANATVIDNPTYVFPVSHVIDVHKQQLLSGVVREATIDTPTDVSALVSAGPYALAAGQTVQVRFVVAHGATLADFHAAVEAAGGSTDAATSVEPDVAAAPRAPVLAQNHPNPFNPSTSIRFALPAAGPARLAVHDLEGRRIRTLVDGELPAGEHLRRWDGRDQLGRPAASGMYVLRLEAAGTVTTRKAVLVK